MSNLDQVFERWLDSGELSITDKQRIVQDPHYNALYQQALLWQQRSEQYDATVVPSWDRNATWFEKDQPNSFNWSWLNGAMLAMSIALCSVIVFTQQSSSTDKTLSQLVALQTEQIGELKTLLNQMQQQNKQQTRLMVQQAIDTGRIERREDITALVDFLKQQRQQDQVLIKLQLNDLAEQVEQPARSLAKNSN